MAEPDFSDWLFETKRGRIAAAVISVVVGLALAFVVGRFLDAGYIYLISLSIYPALLFAVIMGGVYALGGFGKKRWGWALYPVLLALLYAGCMAVAVEVGRPQRERDIAETKAWVEGAGTQLKQYRAEHGQYPPSLNVLAGLPPAPRMFAHRGFYFTDGKSFKFSFAVPGEGLDSSWDYSSLTGEWTLD